MVGDWVFVMRASIPCRAACVNSVQCTIGDGSMVSSISSMTMEADTSNNGTFITNIEAFDALTTRKGLTPAHQALCVLA